jgi:hypothetical protein
MQEERERMEAVQQEEPEVGTAEQKEGMTVTTIREAVAVVLPTSGLFRETYILGLWLPEPEVAVVLEEPVEVAAE